jgi:SAM-dependent methyltransferase
MHSLLGGCSTLIMILMSLPLEHAHRRFMQQAGWTEPTRRHLLRRAGLPNARRVLEIGCGTGAVLRSIYLPPAASLFGIDLDLPALNLAHHQAPKSILAGANAHQLPFGPATFDIVFFHFVLLWLQDPIQALDEARRVTRAGGAVLALAEPDYTGRIDKPASLAGLGQLQTEALRSQGADTQVGSHLSELFQKAGFTGVESGQMDSPVDSALHLADASLEWETLESDVQGLVSHEELNHLAQEDLQARQTGLRVLYVPTYFAWAKVILS